MAEKKFLLRKQGETRPSTEFYIDISCVNQPFLQNEAFFEAFLKLYSQFARWELKLEGERKILRATLESEKGIESRIVNDVTGCSLIMLRPVAKRYSFLLYPGPRNLAFVFLKKDREAQPEFLGPAYEPPAFLTNILFNVKA